MAITQTKLRHSAEKIASNPNRSAISEQSKVASNYYYSLSNAPIGNRKVGSSHVLFSKFVALHSAANDMVDNCVSIGKIKQNQEKGIKSGLRQYINLLETGCNNLKNKRTGNGDIEIILGRDVYESDIPAEIQAGARAMLMNPEFLKVATFKFKLAGVEGNDSVTIDMLSSYLGYAATLFDTNFKDSLTKSKSDIFSNSPLYIPTTTVSNPLTGGKFKVPSVVFHKKESAYLDAAIKLTYNIHQAPKLEEIPTETKPVEEEKFEDAVA